MNYDSNAMKEKEILDLFSGCGGFSLGAELAGFRTQVAIDIDSDLQSSFDKNFPNSIPLQEDITKIDKAAWGKHLKGGKPAGIIGGPPCQGFSRIGKKKADDPRNTLVGHYYRHVNTIKPKFFVMENVEGLLDHGSRQLLDDSLATLDSRYKVIGPVVVNAGDFGAPTDRNRVLVIGYDPNEMDSLTEEDILDTTRIAKTTVRDAIADLPAPDWTESDFAWTEYIKHKGRNNNYVSRAKTAPPKGLGWAEAKRKLKHGWVSGFAPTRHTEAVIERFDSIEQGSTEPVSRYPRLDWNKRSPTLRAGTGSDKGSFQAARPIHPEEPRVITVREAARLQGFPDWFVFHPTKWHSFRMIGNSVSPMVSYHIMKKIYDRLS